MDNNCIEYIVICPHCGKRQVIQLSEDELKNLERYRRGEGCIQELFPDSPDEKRELLMTGLCSACFDSICTEEE